MKQTESGSVNRQASWGTRVMEGSWDDCGGERLPTWKYLAMTFSEAYT